MPSSRTSKKSTTRRFKLGSRSRRLKLSRTAHEPTNAHSRQSSRRRNKPKKGFRTGALFAGLLAALGIVMAASGKSGSGSGGASASASANNQMKQAIQKYIRDIPSHIDIEMTYKYNTNNDLNFTYNKDNRTTFKNDFINYLKSCTNNVQFVENQICQKIRKEKCIVEQQIIGKCLQNMNTLQTGEVKRYTDNVLNMRYNSMQKIAGDGQNIIKFCVNSNIEAQNKVNITLQLVK